MPSLQDNFDRLIGLLDYESSGGLLSVVSQTHSAARAVFLSRVRRHLPEVTHIYFAANVPLVYFSSCHRITGHQIAALHKSVWNDSRAPLLIIIDSQYAHVYDAWAEPTDNPNQINHPNRLIAKLSLVEKTIGQFDDAMKQLAPFHRANLDSGEYANILSDRFDVSTRCDSILLKNLRVSRDRLIESGLTEEAAHNLLIRSILVMHLEHRNILQPEFYTKFTPHARKLTDLYPSRKLAYEAFAELAHRFNGDLLPVEDPEAFVTDAHLNLLKAFLEGEVDVKTGQRMLWPLYDFSIVPIQLISSAYEELLHASDPSGARQQGAYYTPFPLAELMVDEVLPWEVAPSTVDIAIPRIIDPSCGSGVFLVEAFKRLAARLRSTGDAITSESLQTLMKASIFGIDRNRLAIRIAAFSLCLSLVDELGESEDSWHALKFPSLMSNSNGSPPNLISGDAFVAASSYDKPFDLVIGNPPWKRADPPSHIKKWLTERGYPVVGEIAQAFMWLARELAPNGRASMLCPARWLLNREGPDTQARLTFFASCHVLTVINLSALVGGKNRLFNANAPAAGLIFECNRPFLPSPSILHFAPRPGFRTSVPTGMLIDGGDVKWVPRDLAEQSYHVWKIMYAGSWRDLKFVERLSRSDLSLEGFIKNSPGWVASRGFQPGDEKSAPEILDKPFVDATDITRYAISQPLFSSTWGGTHFSRTGDLRAYLGPHVLIKEGAADGKLTAAFSELHCTFRDTVTGVHGPAADSKTLKALTVYLNSKLAAYYLFMTTSWGIDRKRVKKGEVLSLPARPITNPASVDQLSSLFEAVVSAPTKMAAANAVAEIDELIFASFAITESERSLVKDMAETSMDYVYKGIRSQSLQRPSIEQLHEYATGFLSVFGRLLRSGGRGVSATIHCGEDPLSVVSFNVTTDENLAGSITQHTNTDLSAVLKPLERKLLKQDGTNLYRRRHVMLFGDSSVDIIKPAEARFWTESAGRHDADETIAGSVMGTENEFA